MSLSHINSLLAEQYNKYTNNYNIKQTTKHTQNKQRNTHKTNLQITQTKYETHKQQTHKQTNLLTKKEHKTTNKQWINNIYKKKQ